jgi:hypothetical protein
MSAVATKQFVGVVEFDGGNQAYIGNTLPEVYEKIAKTFVESWCHETDAEFIIREHIANGRYNEAVHTYFDDHPVESLLITGT